VRREKRTGGKKKKKKKEKVHSKKTRLSFQIPLNWGEQVGHSDWVGKGGVKEGVM